MSAATFPEGIITVEIDGIRYLAQFMGRQKGFECMVCGKGGNCFTFNLFDDPESYAKGSYETWGFGANHLDHVKVIDTTAEQGEQEAKAQVTATMEMTFQGFMDMQGIQAHMDEDGTWSVVQANGKVLASKVGKVYSGYTDSAGAWDDLERDLVEAGVLIPKA